MNRGFLRIIREEIEHFLEQQDFVLKFKTSVDEDRTTIQAFVDGEKIGSLHMEELFGYSFEFEDVFDEDEFLKIFPRERIIKIEHIKVDDFYKNEGIGTMLMKKGIETMKKKGFDQFYLNASPMGSSGLNLNDLVDFYKKFGFKELLHQGGNVLMALTK